MPAFIQMLPPDRPIFMTGQPIIRLVPSGGPGGELGDIMEKLAVSLAGRKGAPPPPPPPEAAPPPPPMLPSLRPQYPQTAQSQIVAAPTVGSSYVQPSAVPPWGQPAAPAPSPWAQPASSYPAQTYPASGYPAQQTPAGYQPSAYQQAQPYDQAAAQQAAAYAAWDEMYGPDDAMGSVNGAFISPRDLGRLGQQDIDWALQAQLTAAAEGATPDVSAEYFRPKDVPGLSPAQEGPATGRRGVYPKKLRDMVEFDMSGNSAFVSMGDLAALGCCGRDNESMRGLGAVAEAKALDESCDKIDANVQAIIDAVNKAKADSSLSNDAKLAIARQARRDVRALKGTSRACLRRLKQLTRDFKRELKAAGLSKLEAKVDKKIQVEQTKDRLRAMTSEYGTY